MFPIFRMSPFLVSRTSRRDPLGCRRVEAFWNSLSHGCANRDSSVSSSFSFSGCQVGSPPLRRMSRGALAHLAGEKDLACSLLRGLAFNAPPPHSVRRILRSFGHGARSQKASLGGRDLSPGKGYSAAQSVSGNLTQYFPPPCHGDQSLRDEVMKVFRV